METTDYMKTTDYRPDFRLIGFKLDLSLDYKLDNRPEFMLD